MSLSDIVVRGAREHNLKGVDVTLPRLALSTITGVSGSGKSSLAFDTIYQEGQRRYVESLSAYARQFLGRMEKPAVDAVEGLSPTLLIDQKTVNRNPRSTVGTVTEVLDYLRLLFARVGVPHCVECDEVVRAQTVDGLVATLLERYAGRRLVLLASVVRDRKGEYRKDLEGWRLKGYTRAWIDGEERRLDEDIKLTRNKRHTIELVIDRLKPAPDKAARLAEAVEAAAKLGEGFVQVRCESDEPVSFSTRRSCPNGHGDFPEMEPRLFSFNSPHGACPACDGLGVRRRPDASKLIADPSKSIREGALRVSNKSGYMSYVRLGPKSLERVAEAFDIDLDSPWAKLPERARKLMLNGSGSREVTLEWDWTSPDGGKQVRGVDTKPFEGLLPAIERHVGLPGFKQVERFLAVRDCPECAGTRLGESARAVRFEGRRLDELCELSIEDARAFFASVQLSGRDAQLGTPILREIDHRLGFLDDVGLSYLTLDRGSRSLSGGESQRVRLASQVGSGLQGVLYVLDEPSIGLHARDNQRLIETLGALRDRGNTVLVVEHDEDTILASDHVVDIGPGAGSHGGEVLASGPASQVLRGPETLTTDYLRGRRRIELPEQRRKGNGEKLVVRGARQHNLRNLNVTFPLGSFIAVTGVSGSGKSTLVDNVLKRALAAHFHGAEQLPGEHKRIEGLEHLDKVIEIDQLPIGRTPRSNPATYTGLMNHIRDVFAGTPEAKVRGYAKGRFSFNVKGGRCEACEGAGVNVIEMQFLPDVQVPCEVCAGRRYNSETLEILYRGLAVDQVLAMTIEEALEFFKHHKRSAVILQTLVDVGLGYVQLGQPSTTLSGGEAQRMKLASELCRPATGRTLYILDEPTTGLHFEDVRVLLVALQRLVDAGNTLVVVEHNLDVIKVADWVLDLGPEGGTGGGELVASGPPERIAKAKRSHTGAALAPKLVSSTRAPPLPRKRALPKVAGRDLVVKGATLHNLQSVDVTVPHGKLTVVTGPSGSGKTSLAFDTIFAEGQRRFVESLSTYARRFLERMERPPLESVTGLAPAVAIDQKTATRNPRSTVSTSTEIHDYLRILFARAGTPHCWECGKALVAWSPTLAAQDLLARHKGRRVMISASLVSADHKHPTALSSASEVMELAAELRGDGFARVLVDGELRRLEELGDTSKARSVELVIDRLRVDGRKRSRLAEALAVAQQRGLGLAHVHLVHDDAEATPSGRQRQRSEEARLDYEARAGCAKCGTQLPPEGLSPRLFSFNSHVGACPRCEGMGRLLTAREERLVDHPEKPLFDGAMTSKVGRHMIRKGGWHRQLLEQLAEHFEADLKQPWSKLSKRFRAAVLEGTGVQDFELAVHFKSKRSNREREVELSASWKGMLPLVEGWWRGTEKDGWWRKALEALLESAECPTCDGARLRPEALATTVGALRIHEFSGFTVEQALDAISGLTLAGQAEQVAADVLREVRNRLEFLRAVGLSYLALDRRSSTLSGGEAQRIRLASQLGNRLVGVLYVLDEPSIGLHPRDQGRLLATLDELRDLGNTILVVEHDEQTIRAADHVIDIGPGAGRHGGRVVAAGTPRELERSKSSLTGAYLSGRKAVDVPEERREGRGEIRLEGCTLHNLQGFDVGFAEGQLHVVSGVSGSGKSSLVTGLLVPALQRRLEGEKGVPAGLEALKGAQNIEKLLVIDQSPLGRSPHSNAATASGAFGDIRGLFASTPEARMRGFGPGRFSSNVPGGRCEACGGRGVEVVEMHFLSDVQVICEACNGRRFERSTLEVRWKGHSIADVLAMEVDEALEVFGSHRRIARKLSFLSEVGLGYLKLGQPATTLSGGEAQRVKLASELSRPGSGRSLIVLDEPTTGLHADDVARLVRVLHTMVDKGNTLVVIEHNLDVIKSADRLVDLGPEGGTGGGQILAQGTPEDVLLVKASHTGQALRSVLATPRKPRAKSATQRAVSAKRTGSAKRSATAKRAGPSKRSGRGNA
ncbi:MAG: UvrABC system protein A [Planctomycetota bacterium]|nr:MAG: UvrABC system protein A [Planctomycetota bacterium]